MNRGSRVAWVRAAGLGALLGLSWAGGSGANSPAHFDWPLYSKLGRYCVELGPALTDAGVPVVSARVCPVPLQRACKDGPSQFFPKEIAWPRTLACKAISGDLNREEFRQYWVELKKNPTAPVQQVVFYRDGKPLWVVQLPRPYQPMVSSKGFTVLVSRMFPSQDLLVLNAEGKQVRSIDFTGFVGADAARAAQQTDSFLAVARVDPVLELLVGYKVGDLDYVQKFSAELPDGPLIRVGELQAQKRKLDKNGTSALLPIQAPVDPFSAVPRTNGENP